MKDIDVIWRTASAIVTSLGGGAVLVFAFSSWLGKVWAIRLADAERTQFSRDLEEYKNELQQLASEQLDALTRKRDIYARVATSMRVFLAPGAPPSGAEQPPSNTGKQDFLSAFDEAALWASEEVAGALSNLLKIITRHTNQPGSIHNDELQNAYRACLVAMRRDCGFPDTEFSYPLVTFR